MPRPIVPLLATLLLAGAAPGCGGDRITAASAPSAAPSEAPAVGTAGAMAPSASSHATDVAADLARLRHATAAFHDLQSAMAAGYTVWSPDPFAAGASCPTDPNGTGRMGYHLVNVALRGSPAHPAAGDADLSLLHPEMLLWSKQTDGTLRLVGVEYLVFKDAWERVHGAGAAPPTILGQPLLLSSHTFVTGGPLIPHYELHVWAWSHNPLGTFNPWNPEVTC